MTFNDISKTPIKFAFPQIAKAMSGKTLAVRECGVDFRAWITLLPENESGISGAVMIERRKPNQEIVDGTAVISTEYAYLDPELLSLVVERLPSPNEPKFLLDLP